MKIEDLMVGDWVLTKSSDGEDTHYIKVRDIGEHGINMCGFLEFDEIEPIPLTQEILKRNGFEDICGDFWISTSCNLLWKDGKLQNFCREEADEVCIPCEYVHELQHILRLCKINKEIIV